MSSAGETVRYMVPSAGNYTIVATDAAAINYKQRVYIPISQVTKAFSGVNMQWDNINKQVTIRR